MPIKYNDAFICATGNDISLIDSDKICFTLDKLTLSVYGTYAVLIFPFMTQKASAKQSDAIMLNLNEEADVSLEKIAREEGFIKLTPDK